MLNAGHQRQITHDLTSSHLCGRSLLPLRKSPLSGRVAEPAADTARRRSSQAVELQAEPDTSSSRRGARRRNNAKPRGSTKQERSQSILERLLADEPGTGAEPDRLGAASSAEQPQHSSQDTTQRSGSGATYPWRAAAQGAQNGQQQHGRQPISLKQAQQVSPPEQLSNVLQQNWRTQGQEPAFTPPILQSMQVRQYLSPSQHVLEDDTHPLRPSDIPLFTRRAFSRLRAEGYECYVVGGALRDLLLGQPPKDFDLLTSATPKQVQKLFKGSKIVGAKFPIVLAQLGSYRQEISSFQTSLAEDETLPATLRRMTLTENVASRRLWREARQSNAAARDFTVNALLYDLGSGNLYDYCGGVADCAARQLRSVQIPTEALAADPAKIMRAVRLSARARLSMDAPLQAAVQELRSSIWELPTGRLVMELHAMMAYGAAAPSVQLLWQLGLLDIILPHHAAYLVAQGYLPGQALPAFEPLLRFLASLDRLTSPSMPVERSLWMTALAMPFILNSSQRRAAMQGGPSLDSVPAFPFYVPDGEPTQLDLDEDQDESADDLPDDPTELGLHSPADSDWEASDSAELPSNAQRRACVLRNYGLQARSGLRNGQPLSAQETAEALQQQLEDEGCSVPPPEASPYEASAAGSVGAEAGPSQVTVQEVLQAVADTAVSVSFQKNVSPSNGTTSMVRKLSAILLTACRFSPEKMQHILGQYQRSGSLPSKKDEQVALVLYGFHQTCRPSIFQ